MAMHNCPYISQQQLVNTDKTIQLHDIRNKLTSVIYTIVV